MGGKFVVRAGQHLFESGEKVVSPITCYLQHQMTIVIK